MKSVLALLGVFAGLATISYLQQSQAPRETAVYQSVLQQFAAELENSPLTLMSRPTSCGLRLATLAEPDEALFAAFKQANVLTNAPLAIDTLSSYIAVVGVDNATRLKNADRSNNDLGIQIMYLSRVGFAHDSSSALVCLESDYSGMAFVLRLHDTQWQVKQTAQIWPN